MSDAPDLDAWLKRNPDAVDLRLPRAAVAALAQELRQLRQSADRLRKQNKKVRAKVARLKGEPDDEK
jgi:hypothetical protein